MLKQGTFENYNVLNILCELISGDKNKERVVSNYVHRYNREFNAIRKSNLPKDMKRLVFKDLTTRYTKAINDSKSQVTEIERSFLCNFIITKWKKYKQEIREKGLTQKEKQKLMKESIERIRDLISSKEGENEGEEIIDEKS